VLVDKHNQHREEQNTYTAPNYNFLKKFYGE